MDEIFGITDAEFHDAASLVYDRFGIHLTEQKRSLVAGRLAKRVRHLGLRNLGAYLALVRSDQTGAELSEFINRITTNHSFFFREKAHFDFLLKTVIPEMKKRLAQNPSYPIRFWSAGCAAGEEPYTIAILVRDALGGLAVNADWGVLATDVSLTALAEARRGVYSSARLKELPPVLRSAYFQNVGEDAWSVRADIRRSVLFKRLNLMNETYPFKGSFDVVFCRNVMIYFDVPTRKALVERIHRYIKPGGYFFVGHSESLPRETCSFEYLSPATYRKSEMAES
jgi:chemotaxis protein methyltransferase CheR